MRRIRSTGCGYSLIPGKSYTCGGVPKLTEMFKTTLTNIFGTEVIRTATSEEYSNEDWLGNPEALKKGSIDNYAQLPQAFEGFVMTLTPILDMDATAAGPEVPELECRINFDPFAKIEGSVLNTEPGYTADGDTQNDGFLNLYNTGGTYTQVVYVEAKTKEQLQTASVADSLIYYDMPPYLTGSTVSRDPEVGYIIRPNTDPETGKTSYVSLMAGPGILEPMLDTSFPPIGVDTITGPDIIGDFTMWEFNTIAQWQKTVDTRLNNIRIPPQDYTGLDGLINLENAKNQKGTCENFQIKVSGDSVSVIGDDELPIPSYVVDGGVIKVEDSAAFAVMPYAWDPDKASSTTEHGSWDADGRGIVTGAFDAYLDVYEVARGDIYDVEDPDESMIYGATITVVGPGEFPHSNPPDDITFKHLKFEYIGSVISVDTNDVPKAFGEDFKLYEIKQGDCLYEIKIGGGTGGGSCDCKEYAGPFRLVFDSKDGFGIVGSITDYSIDSYDDIVYHAGVIYACGSSVSWPLTYYGYGAGDVYAHITLEDYSITFDNSPFLYDREAEIEIDPETGKPIMPDAIDCYTVRLGYADIAEAVYVDIPAIGITYPVEVDSIYEGMVIPEELPVGVAGSTISEILTVPDSVDDPTIEPREIPIMVYVLVDGQAPARAIPVENTVNIKQYHTGDIYIDCQDIPEPPEPPEPTEPYEYNGPFKLVSDIDRGLVVTGTATDKDGNTQMAGRIYKCGIFEKLAAEGTGLSEGDVFLYVYDDGSIDYGNEDKTVQEEPAQEPVQSNNVDVAEEEDSEEEPEVAYCIRLGHADKTDFVVTIPLSNGEEETLTVSKIAVGDIFPEDWQEVGIIGTTITAINYDETDPQAENPDPISVDIFIPAPEEPGKDPIDPVETTIDTVPFYTIEQYHTGDVYLDCDEEPVPPIVTTYYDGPFKLDKSGSVSCSICPDEGESPNKYSIAGYVSINGTGGAYTGSVRGKSVTLTGGTTNIFVNVTPDGASIATEQNTAPNCYSVWLGSITGATVSDPAVVEAIVVDSKVYHYVGRTSQVGNYAWDAADGTSVYTAGDNAHTNVSSSVFDTSGTGATVIGTVSALIYRYHDGTAANQMHYGNIHVDGRWS